MSTPLALRGRKINKYVSTRYSLRRCVYIFTRRTEQKVGHEMLVQQQQQVSYSTSSVSLTITWCTWQR